MLNPLLHRFVSVLSVGRGCDGDSDEDMTDIYYYLFVIKYYGYDRFEYYMRNLLLYSYDVDSIFEMGYWGSRPRRQRSALKSSYIIIIIF